MLTYLSLFEFVGQSNRPEHSYGIQLRLAFEQYQDEVKHMMANIQSTSVTNPEIK